MIPKNLPREDRIELARQASEAARLERIWRARAKAFYDTLTEKVIASIEEKETIEESLVDFLPFVMRHYFEVTAAAIRSAHRARSRKLGRLAGRQIPTTIDDLRREWAKWRQRKAIPTAQRAIARKLKDGYLEKIHAAWKKRSRDFRTGNAFDQREVLRGIEDVASSAGGRANAVIITETTRYYNDGIRRVFDPAEDITHYLFIAIRDHRTTKWCSTRTGLVYKKDDPLLQKETPPIHWNCRSSITPLTPENASHKKLIDDPKLRRRANSCEPLPKNWRK